MEGSERLFQLASKMRVGCKWALRAVVVLFVLVAEDVLAKKKQDYYQMLGVKRNADDAALKKAYRKVHALQLVLCAPAFCMWPLCRDVPRLCIFRQA